MSSRISAWILLPILLAFQIAHAQDNNASKLPNTKKFSSTKLVTPKATRGKILQYLNRQRSEGATIQLTNELGYNFSGLDLSNINFSNAEIINADFSDSNL